MATTSLPHNVKRLVRYARAAANIGLVLFAGIILYALYLLFTDAEHVASFVRDEFLSGNASFRLGLLFKDAEHAVPVLKDEILSENTSLKLNITQTVIGVILLFLPDFLGVAGIYYARKLLGDFQKGEVFTLKAVSKIRLIGWIIVGISPLWRISETLGVAFFSAVAKPGQMVVHISIEASDFYAIVFGLLIVIIGHVMYEAVRISDENQEII